LHQYKEEELNSINLRYELLCNSMNWSYATLGRLLRETRAQQFLADASWRFQRISGIF